MGGSSCSCCCSCCDRGKTKSTPSLTILRLEFDKNNIILFFYLVSKRGKLQYPKVGYRLQQTGYGLQVADQIIGLYDRGYIKG